MADGKIYFQMKLGNYNWMKFLTDEQIGAIVRASFEFEINGIDWQPSDPQLMAYWQVMKATLELGDEGYEKHCLNSSLGGIKASLLNGRKITRESMDLLFDELTKKGQTIEMFLGKKASPELIEMLIKQPEKLIKEQE